MTFLDELPATSLRVERNTAPRVNARLKARDDAEVARLEDASPEELTKRIEELSHEWDVERLLQFNASVLAFTGTVLGHTVNRRFMAMPAVIFGFFLQHALQGWCPPVPVFRRLGVRTRREIERERYALKALRGDFEELNGLPLGQARVRAVLRAVDC